MKKLTYTLSAVAAMLLVAGCNSSSSSGGGDTDITVERGPLLYATVTDANGQTAVMSAPGRYTFGYAPAYPVRSVGGVIDLNRDGIIDEGDVIASRLQLSTPEGDVATVVTSLATDSAVEAMLLNDFGLTAEEIYNDTPSTNRTVAAISDEVYKYCIENNIVDPSVLTLAQMEQLRTQIQARIDAYNSTTASVETLETELITDELGMPTLTQTEAEVVQQEMVSGTGGCSGSSSSIAMGDSNLTEEQKYTIAYMWNEEKLAKDVYLALNDVYPSQTLYNIATRAEVQHESQVQALAEAYDLNITNIIDYEEHYSEAELLAFAPGQFALPEIQALYDILYAKGVQSAQDALEVGCMVEVTDINDLDQDIATAQGADDLVAVFENLRQGSYNHYWSFDGALKAIGVSEGCCVLGDDYCKTPEEYPANNGGHGTSTSTTTTTGTSTSSVAATGAELTDDVKYTLAYMWNEEKLAKDVYLGLNDVQPSQTLYNIATKAEVQHQESVEALIQAYDINITNLVDYTVAYSEDELRAFGPGEFGLPIIQELYDTLYAKGEQSLQDALEVGCMVEVTDITDLDEDIAVAQAYPDVVAVFENLRQGSYNHYWSFDRALKNIGVTDGCCSLGEDFCKTTEEYPASNGGGGHM